MHNSYHVPKKDSIHTFISACVCMLQWCKLETWNSFLLCKACQDLRVECLSLIDFVWSFYMIAPTVCGKFSVGRTLLKIDPTTSGYEDVDWIQLVQICLLSVKEWEWSRGFLETMTCQLQTFKGRAYVLEIVKMAIRMSLFWVKTWPRILSFLLGILTSSVV